MSLCFGAKNGAYAPDDVDVSLTRCESVDDIQKEQGTCQRCLCLKKLLPRMRSRHDHKMTWTLFFLFREIFLVPFFFCRAFFLVPCVGCPAPCSPFLLEKSRVESPVLPVRVLRSSLVPFTLIRLRNNTKARELRHLSTTSEHTVADSRTSASCSFLKRR